MPTLKNFLPELPAFVEQSQRLNTLSNFMELQKSMSGGETFRSPTIGVDQLATSWLRQSMAYRHQMVQDIMTIAMTVEEIRAPIMHITTEVFRRGIQWKPRFALTCTKCEIDYNERVEECEQCGSAEYLGEPDEEQKLVFNEFLNDCNVFDQSLEEVLRQAHFDVNTTDDAFILLEKEYFGEAKGPVRSKVVGIRRLNPALVEIILDGQGLPKNKDFVCYIHRDLEPVSEPGECKTCNRPLVPAMYTLWHRGSKKYLLDSEIIHFSKFSPSEIYGFSPILTIFEKALTIIGMDKNMYRYFWERKMPASMVMVFTDDPESLRRERIHLAAQMKADPNYIPMVAVSARNNRGRVDMVRLFHTLQEMDYLPVREEIRERIGAMWGVTPVWQGAPEAFGGLSQSTSQLSVMSRVVEGDQRLFHTKVFPLILESFGITDWELELPQPEEKAEATRLAFAQQRISAAQQLSMMGFELKIKSPDVGIADIDFIIAGQSQPYRAPAPEEEDTQKQEGDTKEKKEGADEIPEIKKSTTWISELLRKGYSNIELKGLNTLGDKLWFKAGGDEWVAHFNNGTLLNVEKATFKAPPIKTPQPKPTPPSQPSQPYQGDEPEEFGL